MVSIDSETLFNVAASIVATIAALTFILNVDYGYSPISKIAIVVAFLAAILLITQVSSDYQLTVLGYGVIVTTGIALYFDVANTFDADTLVTVAGLLVIAAVLFGLRTRLDESDRFLTGTQARYLLLGVALLAALVLVVDVSTGGLTYDLRPEQRVEFGDTRGEAATVATVIARNPTPLPERVDAPNYEVCAAGDWSDYRRQPDPDEPPRELRLHANVEDGYNEYVYGFGEKTYPVVLHVDPSAVGGESFPIRVTDGCPTDDTGGPYIALFDRGSDPGVR